MAKKCKIEWQHSRFGWDAVLWEKGRVVNAINRVSKGRKPTAAQKARARRILCGGR